MGGTYSNMGDMTNAYKILVGKPKRGEYFKVLGVCWRIG
jgi:hypothetical protein